MCKLDHDASSSNPAQLSSAVLQLVPDHPAAQEALKIALASSTQAIINHSFRTYLYALSYSSSPETAKLANSPHTVEPTFVEPHVLFVACMFHDLAIIEAYDATPERFEIVGADEAVKLLRKHGVDENSIREAWLAMALHTSPGVGEHLGGSVGAVRLAIMTEFGRRDVPLPQMEPSVRAVLEDQATLPRLGVEKELGDAVVRQGVKTSSKAPSASWAGVLVQSHKSNPDWKGVNKAF